MAPRVYSYIRFSRPEQALGDSLRRQQALAEKYAAEHGMVLDRSLKADQGVSAYSGANLKKGHLGAFIEKVRGGHVPRGSTLLVESLDRLSREDVLDALPLFIEIIKLGIRVVTLCDNQTYDEPTIKGNPMTLMLSLLTFARANEESETKAKRIKAAWSNKRSVVASKKLTTLCPAWLRISADRSKFVGIPDRVAVVKRLFRLAEQGRGNIELARMLNREGVEPWGAGKRKGKIWHSSYIQKTITNRSVLGEFQPHAMVQGERVPTGTVISDYYPRIVSDEQFARVQTLRAGRRMEVGRKVWDSDTKAYNTKNLFTHLIRCGRCGLPMNFINKGVGSKGGTYLACSGAVYRAGKCSYRSIRYPRFEREVLTYLREIDWTALSVGATQEQTELSLIRERIDSAARVVGQNDSTIASLLDGIGGAGVKPRAVVAKIKELEDGNERLRAEMQMLEMEYQSKSHSRQNASSQFALLKKSIGNEGVDPAVRPGLRQQLLSLLRRIDVVVEPEWREVQKLYGKGKSLPATELLFPKTGKKRCFISIEFAMGARRWLLLSEHGGVAQEVLHGEPEVRA